MPLTAAMGQLVDLILYYQHFPAVPFNFCWCFFCPSRTLCLLGRPGRKKTDEHRDLSIWAILHYILPTLRVRFCIAAKTK